MNKIISTEINNLLNLLKTNKSSLEYKLLQKSKTQNSIDPILKIIKSPNTTGLVTLKALEAIEKILKHNPTTNITYNISEIIEAITNCKFEATNVSSDEVVLYKIIKILSELEIFSLDIFETILSICLQFRLSEVLRKFALDSLVRVIFYDLRDSSSNIVNKGDGKRDEDSTGFKDTNKGDGIDTNCLSLEICERIMSLLSQEERESVNFIAIEILSQYYQKIPLSCLNKITHLLLLIFVKNNNTSTLNLLNFMFEFYFDFLRDEFEFYFLCLLGFSDVVDEEDLRRQVSNLYKYYTPSIETINSTPKPIDLTKDPSNPSSFVSNSSKDSQMKDLLKYSYFSQTTSTSNSNPDILNFFLSKEFIIKIYKNYDLNYQSCNLWQLIVYYLCKNCLKRFISDGREFGMDGEEFISLLERVLGYFKDTSSISDDSDEKRRVNEIVERKKVYNYAEYLFRKSPKESIEYLKQQKVITSTTTSDTSNNTSLNTSSSSIKTSSNSNIAKVLFNLRLDKSKLGEYLGKPENINILKGFVELIEFGNRIDEALRLMLEKFRLPGEAQQIQRVVEVFSERFYEGYLRKKRAREQEKEKEKKGTDIENEEQGDNFGAYNNGKASSSDIEFSSVDTVFILAYAMIMLNTDLHNPQVRKRMTKEDFIKNLRGTNDGKDFNREYLELIYESIKSNEIIIPSDYVFKYQSKNRSSGSKGKDGSGMEGNGETDEWHVGELGDVTPELFFDEIAATCLYLFWEGEDLILQKSIDLFYKLCQINIDLVNSMLKSLDNFGRNYKLQLSVLVVFRVLNEYPNLRNWSKVIDVVYYFYRNGFLPVEFTTCFDSDFSLVPINKKQEKEASIFSTLSNFLLSSEVEEDKSYDVVKELNLSELFYEKSKVMKGEVFFGLVDFTECFSDVYVCAGENISTFQEYEKVIERVLRKSHKSLFVLEFKLKVMFENCERDLNKEVESLCEIIKGNFEKLNLVFVKRVVTNLFYLVKLTNNVSCYEKIGSLVKALSLFEHKEEEDLIKEKIESFKCPFGSYLIGCIGAFSFGFGTLDKEILLDNFQVFYECFKGSINHLKNSYIDYREVYDGIDRFFSILKEVKNESVYPQILDLLSSFIDRYSVLLNDPNYKETASSIASKLSSATGRISSPTKISFSDYMHRKSKTCLEMIYQLTPHYDLYPILILLSKYSLHPSKEIRNQSLTFLQRSLLTPDALDYDRVFYIVFELMEQIIGNGEEVRACVMLKNLFLRYLMSEQMGEKRNEIWCKALRILRKYYEYGLDSKKKTEHSDLTESSFEIIKSMILVVSDYGLLDEFGDLTWKEVEGLGVREGKFLLSLLLELFPGLKNEKEVVNNEVEAKNAEEIVEVTNDK